MTGVQTCALPISPDPILPAPYVEKLPFPVRVKEHAVITKVVKKGGKKAKDHYEQLKVQPSVALVKDLTGENVEGGHINFCGHASNVVRPPKGKAKKVGAPVISVKIGDHLLYNYKTQDNKRLRLFKLPATEKNGSD